MILTYIMTETVTSVIAGFLGSVSFEITVK